MMSFAAILGACLLSGGLSVREENGTLSVVLGTVPVVESVSVVRGVADDADVRSSFAVRPDGTKVWNRDRYFQNFIDRCKAHDIELVLCTPPMSKDFRSTTEVQEYVPGYKLKQEVQFETFGPENALHIPGTGAFTGTATEAQKQFFFSDNPKYAVKLVGDHLELAEGYAITNNAPETSKATNNGYVSVVPSAYASDTVTIMVTDSGMMMLMKVRKCC